MILARHYFTAAWVNAGVRAKKLCDAYARDLRFLSTDEDERRILEERWDFEDTQYYAPLQAIILKMIHQPQSFTASDYKLLEASPSHDVAVERPVGPDGADYISYLSTRPDKYAEVYTFGKEYDLDPGLVVHLVQMTPSLERIVSGTPNTLSNAASESDLQPQVVIYLPEIVFTKQEKDENGETQNVPSYGYRYYYVLSFPRPGKKDDLPTIALKRAKLTPTGVTQSGGYYLPEWQADGDPVTLKQVEADPLSLAIPRLRPQADVLHEHAVIRFLGGILMFEHSSFGHLNWNVGRGDAVLNYLHDNALPWKTGDCSRLGFRFQAHRCMALPCKGYLSALTGSIRLKRNLAIPYDVTPVWGDSPNFSVTAFGSWGVKRGGAKIETYLTGTPGALLTAGSESKTPILKLLRVNYASHLQENSFPSTQALPVTRVHISRSEGEEGHLRGATCEVTLDCYTQAIPLFRGNEEIVIQAGVYADGGMGTVKGAPYTVFCGKLLERQFEAPVEIPEEVQISLVDESLGLRKKFCRNEIGSVDGERWLSAIGRSLGVFGIPATRVFVNGYAIGSEAAAQYDFAIGTKDNSDAESVDEGELTPAYDTDALKWIDFLVGRKIGWTWRIEPDDTYGSVVNVVPRSDLLQVSGESLPIAYVLRGNPTDSYDRIQKLANPLSVENFVNTIEVLGQEETTEQTAAPEDEDAAEQGASVVATYCDEESVSSPGTPYYVGEKWYAIVNDDAEYKTDARAKMEGLLSKQSRDIVLWETQGRKLFPGQLVESRVGGLNWLPTGTVLRITGEERDLEVAQDEMVKHTVTYTMSILQLGNGTVAAE
jgi:hypothetical protein